MPSAISFKYKDEEVESLQDYPADYKPNSVEQQIDILRSMENFPFLDPDPAIRYYREVYPTLAQPDWVEGPFVLISVAAFRRHFRHCFSDITDAEFYCFTINLGIEKLAASRPFGRWCEGHLTPDRFRRKARYTAMYDRLYAAQPGSDLIIVGGQYGKYHGGQSMYQACERMQDNELPAGALEGIIMALANPSRYSKFDELDTGFPADEFRPGARAAFSHSPYLLFGVIKLEFGAYGLEFGMSVVNIASDRYGVTSLSVPQ